ncbi:MAG: hypothetical protein IJW78_04050 [Clostridia bacterium]|nr:hypothetical protein [Clostridia bacterium]
MDVFIEQLYEVKQSGNTLLKKAGILLVGSLVILALVFVALTMLQSLASVLFLLAFGVGYFAYLLCGKMDVEYEYILTGSIIDIDRITNQRNRKRMLTFRCADITGIVPVEAIPKDKEVKRFCSKDDGVAFLLGDKAIVFAPNEKFRAEMAKVLPRHLKKELE